jgi:putative DNA primase/helicase
LISSITNALYGYRIINVGYSKGLVVIMETIIGLRNGRGPSPLENSLFDYSQEVTVIQSEISPPPHIIVSTTQIETHPRTDVGNARRLANLILDQVHFVQEWGFMIWDGRRWVPEKNEELMRFAKAAAKSILTEAACVNSDIETKELSAWGNRSLSLSKLKAMIELVKSEDGISARPEDFDTNPWLLNVGNGVIDLKTGLLLAHDPRYMMTRITDVRFDPTARCLLWEQFIGRVLGNDPDLISFVKRAVGYSLTGITNEQVLFFLFGTGQNGKGTFTETLQALLGEYARKSQTETFLIKDNRSGPREDVARLKGARVVVPAEVQRKASLNEALVKDMTGSDTIAARHLYSSTFEFKPEFKLWFYGNYKPTITGMDHGIWRRIRLIPFQIQIQENERDKNLGERLLQELPGILLWAVRGCLEWQKDGLGASSKVVNATDEYRSDMDTIQQFMVAACEHSDNSKVMSSKLYIVYQKWCIENGEDPESQKMFSSTLKNRDYTIKAMKSGSFVMGVRLKENV